MQQTIANFLDTYETPSALLAASDRELQAVLDPVGLQETRR